MAPNDKQMRYVIAGKPGTLTNFWPDDFVQVLSWLADGSDNSNFDYYAMCYIGRDMPTIEYETPRTIASLDYAAPEDIPAEFCALAQMLLIP